MAKPRAQFGIGREEVRRRKLLRCSLVAGVVIGVSLAGFRGGALRAQEEGEAAAVVPALLEQAAEQRLRGDLNAALDLLRQASRALKADPGRGDRDPDNLAVLDMAVRTLVDLGRWRSALPPLRKLTGLRGDPTAAGGMSPADRAALAELEALSATCLAATGDLPAAREAIGRARGLLAGAAAADERAAAAAAAAIAAAQEGVGDLAAAAASFAGVVSKHQASLGLTHPAVAAGLAAGPRLAAAEGRFAAAADLARSALARLEAADAASDPAAVPLLRLIGARFLAEDSYSEAEPMLDRALAISSRVLGGGHPQTLLDKVDQATVMLLRGRSREAEAAAEAAAAAAGSLAEAEDGRAAAVLRKLGDFFLIAGRPERAERLFEAARSLDARTAGETAPALAQDLLGLGRCRLDAGDAAAAVPLLEQAFEISSGRPAADHGLMQLVRARAEAAAVAGDAAAMEPLIAKIVAARPTRQSRADDERLAGLFDAAAACHEAHGEADRGRRLREQLLELRGGQHGDTHPHLADICMSFAVARQAAEAWDDAIDYYQRALAIWEKPEAAAARPEIAAVLMPLARCLQATDRKAEARTALERAREIWIRTLGPDHEVTRAAEAMLQSAGGG